MTIIKIVRKWIQNPLLSMFICTKKRQFYMLQLGRIIQNYNKHLFNRKRICDYTETQKSFLESKRETIDFEINKNKYNPWGYVIQCRTGILMFSSTKNFEDRTSTYSDLFGVTRNSNWWRYDEKSSKVNIDQTSNKRKLRRFFHWMDI